jgi:hypothetical protein
MRVQVGRQRKGILQLQRAGISTASVELLLGWMLAKIEGFCDERDRLKKEQDGPMKGRVLAGVGDGRAAPMVRRECGRQLTLDRRARRAAAEGDTREGHCYQHVQAITVAIDQYAEKALGNRD